MLKLYHFLGYYIRELFDQNKYIENRHCRNCNNYKGIKHKETITWDFHHYWVNHTKLHNFTSNNSVLGEIVESIADNASFTIIMLNCVVANKSANLALINVFEELTPFTISILNDLTSGLTLVGETIRENGFSAPQALYFNSLIDHLNFKIGLFNSGWNNMKMEEFAQTGLACYNIALENFDIIREKKIGINSNFSFSYNNIYIDNIKNGFNEPSYITKYLRNEVHNPHDYQVWMKQPQPPFPSNELMLLTAVVMVSTITYCYLS